MLIILDVFGSFHSLSFLMCGDCETPDPVMMAGEVLGIIILLFCNILAIKGIKTSQPAHLMPWLVVYMIGIITCYVGSVIVMVSSVLNCDWFLPLLNGVIFSIIWALAKSVYSDIKCDSMELESNLKT